MTTLKDKTVVLIGGASGIGFAVARAALDEGAKVVIGSSNPANVEAAVKSLGEGASGAAVDVRDEESLARFFSGVGGIDHLVYTAGNWDLPPGGGLAQLDLAAAAGAFTVRFWGAVAAAKHAAPRLAAGGSITFTDGLMTHRPPKGGAVMSAALGAIEHLTRGLAVDLAPLRVNAVCPGLILTERNKRIPEEGVKRYVGTSPLARPGEPEEVAQAYLYLMRGGYTTGQVLIVDGGRTLV